MWSLKQPMSAKIQREWKSEDAHAALKTPKQNQKQANKKLQSLCVLTNSE